MAGVITAQQLAAELLAAALRTNVAVAAVVKKGATNVKEDWKRNVAISAPRRNAHAARTITYDLDNEGARISAEIGYDKDLFKGAGKRTGPGGIGNLLEFGGGGDRSPAHRDGGRALDAEEPRFISAMEQIGSVVIP